VAINRHLADSDDELRVITDWCERHEVRSAVSRGWELGGEGTTELARIVCEVADGATPGFRPIYDREDPVEEKIEKVSRRIYGANGVTYTAQASKALRQIEKLGLGKLPICMAKTQSSLSDDPKRVGRPQGFDITVREVTIAAGAGFIVPITGEMLRMPGLPKVPASARMAIDPRGTITGLR
jgi:formate--tetrahydrofolate ligase